MWVECVPNFSEGRRPDVLAALRAAAEGPGVRVLGLSADPDHHRSVMTLVGEGPAVLDAVERATAVAVERIDLRRHRGVHPRMGAVDVVPIVPLGDTPPRYCVELAVELGRRIAHTFGVPVFLYGWAATRPERRRLAAVRRGQFEGLAARLADPAWRPDFGPAVPHPTAGAVAIGARSALIAFNAYLATERLDVARRIAARIRESGGGLKGVQALGLALPEAHAVQVSMNVTDWRHAGLLPVLDAVRREARAHGIAVTHTEFIGFVPLEALVAVARDILQAPALRAEDVLEVAALGAAWRQVVPHATASAVPEA
jgi:glutamate formiminotransferase